MIKQETKNQKIKREEKYLDEITSKIKMEGYIDL
jgi:hypothetical protein